MIWTTRVAADTEIFTVRDAKIVGQRALRDGDTELALRAFSWAQAQNNNDSQLLLALGYLHGQLRHDLAAAAWLSAYQTMASKSRASSFDSAILQYVVAARERMRRLFSLAQVSYEEIADTRTRIAAGAGFARSLAAAGEIKWAEEVISQDLNDSLILHEECVELGALVAARSGKIDEAAAMTGHLENDSAIDIVAFEIARFLIQAGDLRAADQVMGQIKAMNFIVPLLDEYATESAAESARSSHDNRNEKACGEWILLARSLSEDASIIAPAQGVMNSSNTGIPADEARNLAILATDVGLALQAFSQLEARLARRASVF